MGGRFQAVPRFVFELPLTPFKQPSRLKKSIHIDFFYNVKLTAHLSNLDENKKPLRMELLKLQPVGCSGDYATLFGGRP